MSKSIATISTALAAIVSAAPAFAAGEGSFWQLTNTDFVVLLAFIVFVFVLVIFKVPGRIGHMLDQRAVSIKSDLDEAKALREEAQALLASIERKQREVSDQAELIIQHARKDAEAAAQNAKDDLAASLTRRLAAADEQIALAEATALSNVKDKAIALSSKVASDFISSNLSSDQQGQMLDKSIEDISVRLN